MVILRLPGWADRAESDVGAAPRGNGSDPAVMRSFARIMFIIAPLMWLFFVALTFGLLGPVGTITPIKF